MGTSRGVLFSWIEKAGRGTHGLEEKGRTSWKKRGHLYDTESEKDFILDNFVKI